MAASEYVRVNLPGMTLHPLLSSYFFFFWQHGSSQGPADIAPFMRHGFLKVPLLDK